MVVSEDCATVILYTTSLALRSKMNKFELRQYTLADVTAERLL